MIDVILTLINGVLGFLNAVLPLSPFDGIIASNEQVLGALGWLNWFIPVGDFVGIFAVYLTALVAWCAADLALEGFGKVTRFSAGS